MLLIDFEPAASAVGDVVAVDLGSAAVAACVVTLSLLMVFCVMRCCI